MDIGSTVIGALIIVLCAIPFIVLGGSGNREKKKMLKEIKTIAENKNCKINEYDFCKDFIIGLDTSKDVLFFLKKGISEIEVIDLAEIEACTLVDTHKTYRNKGVQHRITESLQLKLIPRRRDRQEVLMEFYDGKVNMQLQGELQLVEKWSKIIKEKI